MYSVIITPQNGRGFSRAFATLADAQAFAAEWQARGEHAALATLSRLPRSYHYGE